MAAITVAPRAAGVRELIELQVANIGGRVRSPMEEQLSLEGRDPAAARKPLGAGANLVGKGRRVRTVAVPLWGKQGINA